ncbi:hypothetical protein RJ639_041195 [Escallonia herrerae]|uniref:FLZ-type domain-containing protein n=1 Tax=Escallonia herrerae TaxID=1293975 RepID=A0AA88WJT8_9ASTE|nr:hypothetical protein RJ639_041195 [Escallonia herrerae]
MLKKRTRSNQKDQNMGHPMSDVVSESNSPSDALGQKQKTSSFFNVAGVFVGFSPKGSESDSVRSPTSPLDFRVFSNLGKPFRSNKSSNEGHQKSWDCSKVGLGILDCLDDETSQSGKVLRSSDSKNILFGPQMRIKSPNIRSGFNSFEAPKSLPKNPANFPCAQAKPSGVVFEIGEAPLESESFGKIQSYSLDSGTSWPKFANLTFRMANSSSGGFSVENSRDSVTLPSQFTRGSPKLSSSLGTKLNPAAVSTGSVTDFVGSLSSREIELSEDYTCVITHGPNPKTTHIFGDCILDGHNNEFAHISEKKEQELPLTLTPAVDCSEDPVPYPSDDFLSFCYSCKKKLEGEDIYMYRGEKAFCSWSCRSEEILIEEAIEKTNNDSSMTSLQTNSCEELFETSMFVGT